MFIFIKAASNWVINKFQSLRRFFTSSTKQPNTSLNFQALFESISGCYLILDPDFMIIAVNKAYLRATMTTRETILGRYVFDVFPENPSDQNAKGKNNLCASLKRVLLHKLPDKMAIQRYDIRRPLAEGGGYEERYWSLLNSPLLNEHGEVAFIINHVEDVTEFMKIKNFGLAQMKLTEQKEAEILHHTRELQHLSMLNRNIINATSDLIVFCDTNLCFTQFNQAYQETFSQKFGVQPKIGMSLLKALEKAPKQRAILIKLWKRALRRETSTIIEEFGKEGVNLCYYESKFNGIYDDNQTLIGACKISRNVTEYKQLVVSLEHAKNELETAINAKTKFFNNISHEFRTPLTLMLGPLEDSLEDIDQPLSVVQYERFQLIYRNAVRLLILVNSLLDFSRLETNRMQAIYEPTELSSFTKELVSAFQPAIEKAGLKLELDIEPLDERVYVDKEMWEKIISNLLSNAFKFTLQGCISITLKKKINCVELQVQDTGVGIPEEALPHLFERFFRVESTHGRSIEGTGIGLSMVQDLVQLHKGFIHIKSQLGHGSTFTITLPLGKAHLPPERIRSKLKPYLLKPKTLTALMKTNLSQSPRCEVSNLEAEPNSETAFSNAWILLAEDNPDMCRYIESLLEKQNSWVIETVTNGKEALEAARQHPPDLILTDEMMPQMCGTEFIQAVRQDTKLKSIPIIIISAGVGKEAFIKGLQVGANDYLTKPFSGKELIARVKVQLKLAYLHSQLEKQIYLQQAFIGYEIRNALNIIHDSATLLRNVYQELEEIIVDTQDILTTTHTAKMLSIFKQFKAWVETISVCAEQQKITINEVLNLSKFETNKTQLNLSLFNPKEILTSVVKVFRQQIIIIQKNLTLDLFLPANDQWVEGDEIHFKQVVFNLLANAVKFSEQGNIMLSLTYLPVENLSQLTDLAVTLKDTRTGMTTEEIQRLFTFFGQTELCNDSQYGGSELGLAISKKLIELMGGKIQVESEQYTGATFNFTIRCKKGDTPELFPELVKSVFVTPEDAGTSTINNRLVVDNDKHNQINLVQPIKKLDHLCQVENNAQEALELYKNTKKEENYQPISQVDQTPDLTLSPALKSLPANSSTTTFFVNQQSAALPPNHNNADDYAALKPTRFVNSM